MAGELVLFNGPPTLSPDDISRVPWARPSYSNILWLNCKILIALSAECNKKYMFDQALECGPPLACVRVWGYEGTTLGDNPDRSLLLAVLRHSAHGSSHCNASGLSRALTHWVNKWNTGAEMRVWFNVAERLIGYKSDISWGARPDQAIIIATFSL